MIGKGDNLHQLIYVDDLIDGLFQAAALHRNIPKWHAPLGLFMAAAVMETTFKPLGLQPPLHRRRMDFFRKSFYFKQDKVKKMLQFTPKTSFAQGCALTAAWYKERGLL